MKQAVPQVPKPPSTPYFLFIQETMEKYNKMGVFTQDKIRAEADAQWNILDAKQFQDLKERCHQNLQQYNKLKEEQAEKYGKRITTLNTQLIARRPREIKNQVYDQDLNIQKTKSPAIQENNQNNYPNEIKATTNTTTTKTMSKLEDKQSEDQLQLFQNKKTTTKITNSKQYQDRISKLTTKLNEQNQIFQQKILRYNEILNKEREDRLKLKKEKLKIENEKQQIEKELQNEKKKNSELEIQKLDLQCEIDELHEDLQDLYATEQIYSQPINEVYDMENREYLGQGGFGTVVKARNLQTNEFHCIKIMDKRQLYEEDDRQLAINEIKHLKKLKNCAQIIKLLDIYENDYEIYLVMELCEEEIKFGKYTPSQIKSIMYQVALALNQCHNHDICHRDIKPQNIMIKDKNNIDNSVKLIDFGLSVSATKSQILEECSGTRAYLTPEQLIGRYTRECDVWSFGVCLFKLLTGTGAFDSFLDNANSDSYFEEGEVSKQVFDNISQKQFDFLPLIKNNVESSAIDLILQCFEFEGKRIKVEQLVNHQYFKKK